MALRSSAPASHGVGHLEAIHELTAATVVATSVGRIYAAALDVLIATLSADRAAILLFDPDGVIRFKDWRGLSDAYRTAVEGHSRWRRDEPALLVRTDGRVATVGRPGSLIGVLTDLDVGEDTCDLGPGDALVLFTDGITERRREGRQFDEELVATLQGLAGAPAAELARQVEEAAVAFGTVAPGDDMAVLVICVPGRTAPTGGPHPASTTQE